MRVLLMAMIVTACTREAAPARPPAVPGERGPPAVRRADVPSCPATAGPVDLDFGPRLDVGLAGGVTWLYGSAGRTGALAHLGPTGELVLTPTPFAADLVAVEGSRLWLYIGGKIDPVVPARWAAVDVGDPAAPVVGPVLPLQFRVQHDYPEALAVGRRRALLVTGQRAAPELVVLDTATRTAVAPAVVAGKDFEAALATCDDEHCAVIAVHWEGEPSERRLVVVRAGPDGALEREHLAPGWSATPHAVFVEGGVLVAWNSHAGPRLRALDRRGRPVGPAVAPPPGPTYVREALLVSDGAPLLGLATKERWFVASVGPGAALGPLRELPGAEQYWLFGAPQGDGLAWAGIREHVDYSDGLHFWQSHVIGGFLPAAGRPAQPPTTLASDGGDGRGGFHVHMLARPGMAAAVVAPHGDAGSAARVRMFALRTPCAAP